MPGRYDFCRTRRGMLRFWVMTTGDFFRTLPYFNSFGDAAMERIGREAVEMSFDRGQVIFLEGEPCRGMYVVSKGRVRVFKTSAEGREQVLFVAREGDSFNDVPVFDGGPNPASAAALDHAVVYLLPRKTLLDLVAGCPAAQAVIKMFAARLRHLTAVVEDLSFRSVLSRLARLLLESAVAENGPAPPRQMTQDEMAAMVGTVRDVIGRALRQLESTGAIRLDRHRILVVSPEKLRGLA
jgi:CRP/FNR family cyclic AMP-dependent transcriptional regulator